MVRYVGPDTRLHRSLVTRLVRRIRRNQILIGAGYLSAVAVTVVLLARHVDPAEIAVTSLLMVTSSVYAARRLPWDITESCEWAPFHAPHAFGGDIVWNGLTPDERRLLHPRYVPWDVERLADELGVHGVSRETFTAMWSEWNGNIGALAQASDRLALEM